MSFIPGEQSDIAAVASLTGSGISVSTTGDIDYVATNLIAGPGIAIVPSVSNTSITISSTGSGGGISSVSSGVGSGITATTVGEAVSLTSALVAGAGISLAPAGVGNNLTINNTQTLSAGTGSGIALTPSGNNTAIAANLVGGTGIGIVPSGLNSSQTINNTGVTSVTGGAGISVSQSTGAIGLTNTGVLQLLAGSGITLSGSTGVITISAASVASKTMNVVDFPTAGANSWVVPAGVTSVIVEAIGGGGGCGVGNFSSQPTNGSPTILTALAGTISALGGVVPSENQGVIGTGANYWNWTNGQANSGKGGFGSYWTGANGNGQTIAGSDGQRIVRSIATTPGETISVSVGVAGAAPGTSIGGANGGTGYAVITYYM
jgi:hypothetical protein